MSREGEQVRAVVYCRISQDRTGQQAGVSRQEADGRALASERGWEVAGVLVDNDVSAHSGRTRPAYDEMRVRIRSGEVQAVVVWHPDRLYRRMRDLEDLVDLLEGHAVEVATVRAGRVDLTTASGRFHARMMGAVGQYESEIKSERVARAAAARAEAGKFSGGMRPYGYERDGMTVREEEARHIRALFADIGLGVSLREAVRRREAEGAVSATGKRLSTQHVRTMLLSPRFAGLSEHRGVVVGAAEWPAIVSEETWRAARAILTDPARRTSPGNQPRHLLSGVTFCGVCNEKCRVSATGGKRQKRRYVYRCPRGHVQRSRRLLEAYAVEQVLSALDMGGATGEHVGPRDAPLNASVLREAESLRERRDHLAEDYADGQISREQLRAGTAKISTRLDAIEKTVRASTTVSALAPFNGRPPRDVWPNLEIERQRALVSALMQIVLHPVASGQRAINPQGVEIRPLWPA